MTRGPVTVAGTRRVRRVHGTRVLAVVVATGTLLVSGASVAAGQATSPSNASSPSNPSNPSVAQLQSEVEATNARYFATLADYSAADVAVRDNEAVVAILRSRAAKAKALARARALVAYKSSGAGLAAIVEGGNALDAAQRAHLIDRVNARDRSVYRSLRVTARELKARQQTLRDARARQEQSLADLQTQGRALDAKLAQAQAQTQAQATARETAAKPATTTAATQGTPAGAATTTTSPAPSPPPTTIPPPPAPTVPPGYSGTPGTSPHHDDPFLACVRARESGGNYSAVNPAGPYLGAYQFLQSTWNGAAAHAGRMELVGVPANVATPYDQDEVAWSLYQWQGAGPWGGHCP